MRQKKTISIQELKNKINSMIEKSYPELKEGRQALALLLEGVLMDTGNYKGFGYIDHTSNSDQTRVRYY